MGASPDCHLEGRFSGTSICVGHVRTLDGKAGEKCCTTKIELYMQNAVGYFDTKESSHVGTAIALETSEVHNTKDKGKRVRAKQT